MTGTFTAEDIALFVTAKKQYQRFDDAAKNLAHKRDKQSFEEAAAAANAICDYSVKNFDRLTPDWKEYVTKSIIDILPIDNNRDTTRKLKGSEVKKFISLVEPFTLFKAVHLYGLEVIFTQSIKAGDFPQNFVRKYKNWKNTEQNKKFIAECAQPNAPAATIEDRYAVPEELALFEQAKTLATATQDLPRTLEKIEDLMANNTWSPTTAENHVENLKRKKENSQTPEKKKLYELLINIYEAALQEDNKERIRRQKNAYGQFIEHVVSHRFNFDSEDYDQIYNDIRIFYKIVGQKNVAEYAKALKIATEYVKPFNLFKAIHIYGVADDFEEQLKRHTVPQKFRLAYPNWKKKNAEFINDCATLNICMRDKKYLESMANQTSDQEEKKFYTLCYYAIEYLIQGVKNPNNIDVKFYEDVVSKDDMDEFFADTTYMQTNLVRLLNKNWHLINEDNKIHFMTPFYLVFTRYQNKPLTAHPLNTLPVAEFFNFVNKAEQENVFKEFLATGQFPHVTFADYERWKENPDAFVPSVAQQAEAPAPATPETTITEITAASIDSRITHIDVQKPLVSAGNRNESMGYRPVDEDGEEPVLPGGGNDFRDKTRPLIAALLSEESGIKHLTVRWDKRNPNDDEVEGKPYNLIDVEMHDGSRSRIAVCDYLGHTTYVERDAPPTKDEDVLLKTELRKNKKVWTALHVTNRQWTGRIQELLFTPVDKLDPEIKNRSYWHSLKGVLVESFAATVMATGTLPASADKTAIIYGPLAGRTTWSRAYQALHRGAMAGTEQRTTFNKLFEELAQGSLACLQKFINRPAISEDHIKQACSAFRREWDTALDKPFLELLMMDGPDLRRSKQEPDMRRNGLDIDLAIRMGAVAMDDHIQQHGNYPAGLEEYLKREKIIVTPPELKVA